MVPVTLFARHLHGCDNPFEGASPLSVEIYFMLAHIIERLDTMATQAQLTKLATDVAALITAGVAEITAAVAAAQTASPDPAIDDLDNKVTAATQVLTTAAATLTNPPANPPGS